ncbi:MAG: AAA family ATPase [Gammaproteobacteria bacterium]
MSDLNEVRTEAAAATIHGLLSILDDETDDASPALIETHISWVILAGEFAYKIKKPVDLGFLDFSTLELREHLCREELRLNRRFAPSLYLDVVPIGGSTDAPDIGATPAIEWAVKMRRFPADAELDHRVNAGLVAAEALRHFGGEIAAIHADAEISEDTTRGSNAAVSGPALDNFATLERELARDPDLRASLDTLRTWTTTATDALAPTFDERLAAGRIRECHGDLHLGNIVQIDSHCIAFDCLEFNPELRWIDVISDVGFLTMDLFRVDRPDLACEFLNRYLEVSQDYAGLAVLPYYVVYRAMVRAKTTALRLEQQHDRAFGNALEPYVRIARRASAPPATVLTVCHGLSGSGKTWLSDRLIGACPAIRIRSDLVRKHLHGLGELERSDSGIDTGIYAAEASARTYAALATHAALGLRAGFDVIVDATCLRRDDRQQLLAAGRAAGARTVLLHCTADRDTLAARIRRRESAATDASEAGLAVLDRQLQAQEPLSTAELSHTVVVDTTTDMDIAAIANKLREGALK